MRECCSLTIVQHLTPLFPPSSSSSSEIWDSTPPCATGSNQGQLHPSVELLSSHNHYCHFTCSLLLLCHFTSYCYHLLVTCLHLCYLFTSVYIYVLLPFIPAYITVCVYLFIFIYCIFYKLFNHHSVCVCVYVYIYIYIHTHMYIC